MIDIVLESNDKQCYSHMNSNIRFYILCFPDRYLANSNKYFNKQEVCRKTLQEHLALLWLPNGLACISFEFFEFETRHKTSFAFFPQYVCCPSGVL